MANYNFKIVRTDRASGYCFENKYNTVNEWFDAAEMLSKFSSSLYLFRKVSGKWQRIASVNCKAA